MLVKNLKQALENLPDNLEVYVEIRDDGFTFQPVSSVEQKEIDFYEDDESGVPLTSYEVVALKLE